MSNILFALLLAKGVAATIDRESLDLQARAESLQPRSAPVLAIRPISSGGTLDFGSVTTICRAAGSQADPASFIARLSRAYSLSNDETLSLRASCAAYLTGQAEARRAR